jgi:DNA adenine methylase
MMRFNRKGGFNVPFCRKPNRFAPALITKISNQVENISQIIDYGDYEFKIQDFKTTIKEAGENDLIYSDPPYIGRHTDYFNSWTEEDELSLKNELYNSKAKFILSTWLSNKHRFSYI